MKNITNHYPTNPTMTKNQKMAYEYGRWLSVVDSMQKVSGRENFYLPHLMPQMRYKPMFFFTEIMTRTRFDRKHERMLFEIDLTEMPENFTGTEWGYCMLGFWAQKGIIHRIHD